MLTRSADSSFPWLGTPPRKHRWRNWHPTPRPARRPTPLKTSERPPLPWKAECLLGDFKTLGFLFKSLVVRDLRIYAQAREASVWHSRDSHGNEVDAIVDWGDGRWMAVEVKLGSMDAVDESADTLNRVCQKVDHDLTGPPARKMVIAASGYAYDCSDGVTVVPLTALTI